MPRILLIEDDEDLQKVLRYNFAEVGYEVLLATHGRQGLEIAQDRRPDVVLLDLVLPDMSGTDVCRNLKAETITRYIPIIILSAKGEELDRVVGFELGADDYVVKPFSTRELLLRVQVSLRRAPPPAEPPGSVSFGRLRFDRAAHRVWVDGSEIDLSPLQLRLLVALFDRRRSRVQTRKDLLEKVWGVVTGVGPRTIDLHVKRLREKLGAAGDYIETVRGVGYRFAGDPDDGGD
jgi:two-component system phosphate regulon response regulator PhoB